MMRIRYWLAVPASILIFLVWDPTPVAAQAPMFEPEVESIEWLGTFNGVSAVGRAINRHGDVTGLTYAPSWAGGWAAFTYINGVGQSYPTPTGYTSSGEAINDGGLAVGYMPHLRSSVWYHRATVLPDRTLYDGAISQAHDINSAGIVTGMIRPSEGAERQVFRWHPDGELEILSDIGLSNGIGLAINDAGRIAGYYSANTEIGESHLFIVEPDNSLTLLPDIGFEYPQPTAINEAGHVVGNYFSFSDAPDQGFYWDGETYTFMPLLPGDAGFSTAEDINNRGQIVGYSRDCVTKKYCDDGVLWQDGVLYRLTDLAKDLLQPDDHIGETYGISDNGWITGAGYNSATDRFEAYRMKLVETAVAAEESAARMFTLHAPYPNPASGRAALTFDLHQAGDVHLAVFDVLGREVTVLVDDARPAGRHDVVWDAAGSPAGLYILRLVSGTATATQKVVLLR